MIVRELIEALKRTHDYAEVHIQTPRGTEMADCKVTGVHLDDDSVPFTVWLEWPTERHGSGESEEA